MTVKRLLFAILFVLSLFTLPTSLYGQQGDRDGDGVPDRLDNCPDTPGPRENGGCPFPDTAGIPDRDGDGVADFVDACPDQPGTGFTNGCPDTVPSDQPVMEPRTMTWQSLSECLVGVLPGTNVNVREEPTTASAIIGQLVPGQQFAPYFRDYDENGDVWFGGAPTGGSAWGWAAGSVVIDNGQCASLPMIIHVSAEDDREPFSFDADLLSGAPYMTVVFPDIVLSSYQFSGNDAQPDSSDNTPFSYQNTFQAIPVELLGQDGVSAGDALVHRWQRSGIGDAPAPGGGTMSTDDWDQPTLIVPLGFRGEPDSSPDAFQFTPLFFIQYIEPLSPDAAEADCEGYCFITGVLLPSFGDAPGQCPPQMFIDGLQTAFPDGDQTQQGSLPKLLEAAINGNSPALLLPLAQAAGRDGFGPDLNLSAVEDVSVAGLLLPAVQIVREASSAQGGRIEYEWSVEEGESAPPCMIIAVLPGSADATMGDGSVMPTASFVLLLPYAET